MTQQSRQKSRLSSVLISISSLTVFCLLFLGSSPLRQGNWWPDTNAMLTIGQGFLEGKIPFKDLFEQRGPVLYLYYLLANIINDQGYLGLFIIELLNLIGLWAVEKSIIRLYYPTISNWKSAGLSLLLPFLLVGSTSFETGGSPEEFAAFWLLLSLYSVLCLLKQQRMSIGQAMMIGVSGGIVFWIKYTLIAPWLALGITMLTIYYRRHQVHQFWVSTSLGLLGGLLISTGMLVYFQLQHGLAQLWQIYFLTNITAYSNSGTITLLTHMILVLRLISIALINQPIILVMGIITLVSLARTSQTRDLFFIISLTLTTNLLLSYWSMRDYPYMFLTTAVLAICGFPIVFNNWLNSNHYPNQVLLTLIVLASLAPSVTNKIAMSVPWVTSKAPYAPQDFGRYIAQHTQRSPSLIYFNTIDIGVGRYTKLIPQIKYFEETNLSPRHFPIQRANLNRSVTTGQSQYIVYDFGWSNSPVDLKQPRTVTEIRHQLPRLILRRYHVVKISKTRPVQNRGSIIGQKKNRIFVLLEIT